MPNSQDRAPDAEGDQTTHSSSWKGFLKVVVSVVAVITALAALAGLLNDSTGFFKSASEWFSDPADERREQEAQDIAKLDPSMTYDQIEEILGEKPYSQPLSKGRHIHQFDLDLSIIQVVTDPNNNAMSLGIHLKDPAFKPPRFGGQWSPMFGSTVSSFFEGHGSPDRYIAECGHSVTYMVLYDQEDLHHLQRAAVGATDDARSMGAKISIKTPCEMSEVTNECETGEHEEGSTLPTCPSEMDIRSKTEISSMVVTRPLQPLLPEMLCRPQLIQTQSCPDPALHFEPITDE